MKLGFTLMAAALIYHRMVPGPSPWFLVTPTLAVRKTAFHHPPSTDFIAQIPAAQHMVRSTSTCTRAPGSTALSAAARARARPVGFGPLALVRQAPHIAKAP